MPHTGRVGEAGFSDCGTNGAKRWNDKNCDAEVVTEIEGERSGLCGGTEIGTDNTGRRN